MSWWQRFRQNRQERVRLRAQALAVHDHLASVARQVTASGHLGLPDGFPIRFEVLMWLVARQRQAWQQQGGIPKGLIALLWEITCEGFDASMRERGVADLRMASRMRRLMRHASGRMAAYDEALAGGDPMMLRQVIARNILDGADLGDDRIDWLLAQVAQVDG